jgi:zinc protease
MERVMARCVVFLIGALSAAAAWGQSGSYEKVATVEGVSEYRWANGARVILFPEAAEPTITVNMTVLVGSRHEGYGEAGMAHLLEHMVFKGTPAFPKIPTALRDHGANFNGTTNQDRTNYFETLPATDENLEFAIHMEADRLVNSYVKLEDLQSEFTVVRNEFERGENSPPSVLSDRVSAAAFEWHNYGKTTIGNRSDIERVPIENLQAFYRKYYQPDNVVLIITGRFQPEKALELCDKYLGSIPKPQRELKPTYTLEPPQDGERVVELRRVGQIGSLLAVYHIPAAAHEDWAPLSVLASVISEDKVGLLDKKLIETKLATSASARADNAHDPSLFSFSVQPSEGNLDSARLALLQTIDGIGGETFDPAAISRAKMRSQRAAELLLADAGRMAAALSSAASLGDWRLLFIQRDRVQEVTPEVVQRVAKKYFPPHNRTLGVFIPTEQPMRAEVPSVESIAELVNSYKGGVAMESGEAFDSSPENLDARTQTVNVNGLEVALLQKKNRGETVTVTLTLRYGNEESLRDKVVAAGLLPGMMMAGTKAMNRQALQAKMTELGVQIAAGGGGGGGRGRRGGGGRGSAGALSFSIEAKRSSLAPAIKLLGEILRQPAFPQDDFDQMKGQMTNMLKQMLDEPQMKAGIELSRALSQYPQGDPRYVPTTEESIEQLDRG